ncbi:hypothetical protein GWI33_002049 [Rhynchophorus ferrugineus]|uniref:Uncharacterized protein n=1 Tax=Rhynchophorus ferrugineus TaxID=354439 RepID=A0A834IZN2_RHYFE|nr:hypothetical protein GWI33_002049 [Rhynchophorus ferrugineus]
MYFIQSHHLTAPKIRPALKNVFRYPDEHLARKMTAIIRQFFVSFHRNVCCNNIGCLMLRHGFTGDSRATELFAINLLRFYPSSMNKKEFNMEESNMIATPMENIWICLWKAGKRKTKRYQKTM